MKMTKCEKEHFFDSDTYRVCPYCIQGYADATVPLGYTAPDLDLADIAAERELGKKLTELYIDDTDSADDNDKTIGLGFTAEGINPVVGWLVCEDGPERGRSYPLYSGRNFVGRAHHSDVAVYDDKAITRDNHCSIVYEPVECVFYIVPSAGAITMYEGRLLTDASVMDNETSFRIGNSTFRMIAYCKKGRSW